VLTFMLLHFTICTVITYYLSLINWKLLRICKTKTTKLNTEIKFVYIGGGKANMFSFDELMPEATSYKMHSNSAPFKFVSYMLKNEAVLLNIAENAFVVVDHPFKQLTPKLTITDLKIIAASHGIFVQSKMNHISIQTAIQNHVCSNCSTYTSVFKLIDEEAIDIQRKSSYMKILKTFKDENPKKYKAQNLITVQKYNNNNHEQYSKQHLTSVQKFKSDNPEKYNKQNLAAVQKFKSENPEKYSKQNLAFNLEKENTYMEL
jgi:hypothetical protein